MSTDAAEKGMVKGGVGVTAHEYEHIYSVSGGICEQGFYAFGLFFHDRYEGLRYHRSMNMKSYQNNLVDFKVWGDRFIETKREIKLVKASSTDGYVLQTVCRAARIDGPVCPKELTRTPVAVWTQKDDGEWSLVLCVDGNQQVLLRSSIPLKNPSICKAGCRHVIAYETEDKTGGIVHVVDERGVKLLELSGRRPQLAAHQGTVFALMERFVADGFRLELHAVDGASVGASCQIVAEDNWYALNGDLAVDPSSGELHVAYEVSPKWGLHETNCQYRELRVRRLRRMAVGFDCLGEIKHALPRLQVTTPYTQPIIPVRPRLFANGDRMVLTYKTFALKRDHKQTGWHLWWSEISGDEMTVPALLSDEMHAMDTGYSVVLDDSRMMCALPCVYQQTDWGPSVRHWLKLYEAKGLIQAPNPAGYVLSEFGLEKTFSHVTKPVTDKLKTKGAGVLLWCDPHQHCLYSKCQSKDGAPDEKIRYQRDVLGWDILCLADHVPGMSSIEYVWTYDMLEREGGHDGLVLFGNECNNTPGRHTIYYARKRDVFDRFRCAYGSVDHPRRDVAYAFVREMLPKGEMLLVRHAHLESNKQGQEDEETLSAFFDPELEVACEAVQSRGNALMTRIVEPEKKLHPFPTAYLDAGYRVGFWGGTDHSNGEGAIHFAATGIWASRRDMDSVWRALWQRRTIANSDARIALYAECNGVEMGGTVKPVPALRFDIQASCAYGIARVGILRNGEMQLWQEVRSEILETTIECKVETNEKAWYAVVLCCGSVFGETAYAHASPFFLTNP